MNAMKQSFLESVSGAKLSVWRWEPENEVRAVVQIVHGVAEHGARYAEFAQFLNQAGILVVAEDHMGHGASVGEHDRKGYFEGGWFAAVEDTYRLLQQTKAEFPEVPYILMGHSMGSFMARTMLCKYPDSDIAGCIISGTAWMPDAVIKMAGVLAKSVCALGGERKPSEFLKKVSFGSYNNKVEHPRTENDWLSRDDSRVDAYNADPMCGFTVCGGLQRAMAEGLAYIQNMDHLANMEKQLPVLFVAGGDDPVGAYGDGVRRAADKFREAGMENVQCKIYPLCRHEILNEINRQEISQDILSWIQDTVF